MKHVFLDTSGLIALVNTDDQWHSAAESAWTELINSGAEMVTTSLVLVEIGDGLSRINFRPLALQIREGLHSSQNVRIVQSSASLEEAAWQLFQTDKTRVGG